jgi:hypothetical protein
MCKRSPPAWICSTIVNSSFHIVTTGPLERSHCRIHLRGRCQFVEWCLFQAEVTLERAGWVPSLETQVVSKKSIVCLSNSLLRIRSLFWRRRGVNETNTWAKVGRISAEEASRIYGKVETKGGTNAAHSLLDQWACRAPRTKQGRKWRPGDNILY